MSRHDPDVIDSVEKAFRLMQCFSAQQSRMTVSEAAQAAGLSRATARRLLLTFERLGFAESDGRSFGLTPRVLRLGFGYLSALPYWETAQPHMRALADELRESCSMAVLDRSEIVYVARVPAARSMSITLSTGSRLPAYATSMGRVLLASLTPDELEGALEGVELLPLTARTVTDRAVLLAELERVREQGYAVVDGEREEGVRSAAAPVRGRGGRVLAALNVSANAGRVSLEELRTEFVPRIVQTADALTLELGWTGLH
ncbi:IclR family transcriptional regulator C-terminal domain-containing protein [Streptomyces sp. NPDC048277]|uniref:IclR family transcriptional regulator domain-containing protein n=1 Tax=Streptomyces sp. NPDC048277 TaxID=3155027 RepID=UPI0033F008D9